MITNREIIKLVMLDVICRHQQAKRSGRAEESIYGADLIKMLEDRLRINGKQVIKVGANVVYPILQELSEGEEEEVILRSWWVGETHTKNRYKRYYQMTNKGHLKFEQMKRRYSEVMYLDKLLLEKVMKEVFV